MRIYLLLALCVGANFAPVAFAAGVVGLPPSVQNLVVRAFSPDYPVEARRLRRGGTGIYLLRVQIKSGAVTQVIVGRSAGDSSLDRAAVKALLRWRFKPGAFPYRKIRSVRLSPPQTEAETLVKLPMTFIP
jgi:TonB family protein